MNYTPPRQSGVDVSLEDTEMDDKRDEVDNTAAGREQEQTQERPENDDGTFTLQELLQEIRRDEDQRRPPAAGFGPRRDR